MSTQSYVDEHWCNIIIYQFIFKLILKQLFIYVHNCIVHVTREIQNKLQIQQAKTSYGPALSCQDSQDLYTTSS